MADRSDDSTANDCCTNCGDPIDTDEWHPVRTLERDGTRTVYTFCSTACREAWEP